LSLALLDAVDDAHAQRTAARLAGVCAQFLNWPVETDAIVRPVIHVSESLVMCCRGTHDKTAVAAGTPWQVVGDFLERAKTAQPAPQRRPVEKQLVAEVVMPSATKHETAPQMKIAETVMTMPAIEAAARPVVHQATEVLDLADGSDTAILSAVLRHRSGELVECPVAPPMCPQAKLAVTRNRRVVMLAVAHRGLGELPTIGDAYRWLQENKMLIGMAVPQLAIDVAQMPRLSLFVDESDSRAQTLRPMMAGGDVTVQTYRTLTWSGRTGLMLEAA
jgi:hypothetical protein